MKIIDKPWGSYTTILDEEHAKVKKIFIAAGQCPSYQYHFKRSEVWVIVKGEAKIKIDDIVKQYKAGEVISIPTKAAHQVTNIGNEELIFIEVQLGTYFGEDDIVRLEDKYGRV